MTASETAGLPANLHAERLLLGSILLNGDRYADVAANLPVHDFSLEKHRRIHARMAELYERGEAVDRVTLADELTKRGQLESVDGLSYLISLDEGLPEIVNLESYVRIVKDKALLRETMFACQKIIDQCALASEPSTEILETGAAVLESVRNKAEDKRGQWVTAAELLGRNVDSVLFPARGSIGLKTPWPRLTEMTSGWSPADLVIVAGRPSMGKSVIAMQQALTTAGQGVGVAYFSLEMSKESLVRRLIAGISRVDAHRARSRCINTDERRRMLEAAADLQGLPLFMVTTYLTTPGRSGILKADVTG